MRGMRERGGFTLIELLIVVAIIAILAAIAVPNFLEAQLRAKVGRVKADIRTAATALEAYGVDNNAYPIIRSYWDAYLRNVWPQYNRGPFGGVYDLTTPIAYLTTVFLKDPFVPEMGYDEFGDVPGLAEGPGMPVSRTIHYVNITECRRQSGFGPCEVAWVIVSYGPDKKRGPIPGVSTTLIGTYAGISGRTPAQNQYFVYALYDPTNGTVSGGDIFMYQGRGF